MATSKSINPFPKNYSYASAIEPERAFEKIRVPKGVKPGPNAYAVFVEGDCLLPEFCPSDTAICDPDEAPEPGDYVAIWWRDGTKQPAIKRLTMGLPERKYWHIGGDLEFLLMLEQLNPPKALSAKLAKVEAVHKVIHRIPAVN